MSADHRFENTSYALSDRQCGRWHLYETQKTFKKTFQNSVPPPTACLARSHRQNPAHSTRSLRTPHAELVSIYCIYTYFPFDSPPRRRLPTSPIRQPAQCPASNPPSRHPGHQRQSRPHRCHSPQRCRSGRWRGCRSRCRRCLRRCISASRRRRGLPPRPMKNGAEGSARRRARRARGARRRVVCAHRRMVRSSVGSRACTAGVGLRLVRSGVSMCGRNMAGGFAVWSVRVGLRDDLIWISMR